MKLFFSSLIMSAAALYGQDAQLSGLISDSSKAVVPGATVAVSNTDTGLKRTVQSNHDGYYTITLLPPGTYVITVRAAGFQTAARDNVKLEVAQEARVDFSLEIGKSEQTITVNSEAPLLQTESAVVGTVVNRQFIENMPLNGRSFQGLISLTPGVVLTVANSSSVGQFSINGQRPDANYFTIDGASANVGVGATGTLLATGTGSGIQSTAGGGYNNQVSLDAMQEFKIDTSTFAPEYGRQPGGQVIITTRSGTNSFHGSAFDYLRNTALDANNWFNNALNVPQTPERQNDFGGVLGGPILKNRLFFFSSYEGLRLTLPVVASYLVPSISARQAADPNIAPLIKAFPLPNAPQCVPPALNCDPNVGTFNGAYSSTNRLNATSLRMDWIASSKMTFFVRGNDAPSNGVARSGASNIIANDANLKTLTVGSTYLVSPRISNNFRFNYTYVTGFAKSSLDDFGGEIPAPNALLFPGGDANHAQFQFGGKTIPSYAVGVVSNSLARQRNYIDTVSFIKGDHQLKFGADYRRLTPVDAPTPFFQSYFFTNTTAQWVQNTPNQYSVRAALPKYYDIQNFSLYAEDIWKIRRRLTLTYGLRWDLDPAPSALQGPAPFSLSSLDFNNLAATTLAPNGTPPWHTEWRAFAPRVGIAYQMSQDPRWGRVIRGGFGLFFDTGDAAAGFLAGPNQNTLTTAATTPAQMAAIAFPVAAGNALHPTIPGIGLSGDPNVADPNLRMPYVYQVSAAVEQSLGTDQIFTITYAGAIGRELLRRDSTQTVATLTNILNLEANRSSSSYHSLQLLFRRRYSHGFQTMTSYVWSHAIDTGSSNSTGGPSTALEPISDYRGNADFDIRHAFQSAVSWDVPSPSSQRAVKAILGHWGADFIFRAHTGPPIDLSNSNLKISNLVTAGVGATIRPDVIAGVPMVIGNSNAPGGWSLNPAAFVQVPAGTLVQRQGTLGRNQLRNFGWNQLDFTLRRDFPLHFENMKLQVRLDTFNLLNHPAFYLNGNALSLTSPQFGSALSTLNNALGNGSINGGFNPLYQIGGPRSLQVSLKLVF